MAGHSIRAAPIGPSIDVKTRETSRRWTRSVTDRLRRGTYLTESYGSLRRLFEKWQTHREVRTQSHGSHRDRRVTEKGHGGPTAPGRRLPWTGFSSRRAMTALADSFRRPSSSAP